MEFKEKADEKMKEWNKTIDDLQAQLSLGKDEAIENLEKQKANFIKFINETRDKVFAFAENINPEVTKDLKTKFEELQLQLALGKADSKDAFEEQKEKINSGLDSIQEILNKALGKVEQNEKVSSFMDMFDGAAESFKTKLEATKLQFALGKAEAGDSVEKNKKEVLNKINEIKAKIEENKEVAEEKWDGFRSEISEAFGHVKNAFKKL